MAQLDLGRATLRIRDSPLQLHIFATANLSQLQIRDKTTPPRETTQLFDPKDVWITGAPEMQLRFFLGYDWRLRSAVNILATTLRAKLDALEAGSRNKAWDYLANHQVQVWSELGFSAVLSTGGVGETDIPGKYTLSIGLRKQHPKQDHKRHWTLPTVMVKPPDISPLRDVSTATLVSVDISLEYCFHKGELSQAPNPFMSKVETACRNPLSVSSSAFELELQAMAEARLPEARSESTWLEEMLPDALFQHLGLQVQQKPAIEPAIPPGALQRLFELGLRRLMIPNKIRDPEIWVSDGASLISLADFAPVVFKLGHQEAINQRGVTMPIITKAISAMLKGGQNPSLQAQLTSSMESSHSTELPLHEIDSQGTYLRTAIHSKLWNIAQKSTSKPKPLTQKSFLLPASNVDTYTHETEMTTIPMPVGQKSDRIISGANTGHQVHPDEAYEGDSPSFLRESHCPSETEEQLLDNYSDSSFMDLGESTQSSLDTLFSAAPSSQTTGSNEEAMLFSDDQDVADCREFIMEYPYSAENIGSWDSDLIMTDEV
ncbi:unnamed protein product [Penicillium salamii]|uniref:Uncharacterized protein n=1 Tax=Penicillium salamii TaxID=1612424 RepID=A0A9W4NMD8_9EURO|nr:unnamed protein product [Penicillium salamii]CAG8104479.1 unnamed protein product [Penicillium salamii]CAG8376710.1 unnamed protein product [Penicillium salamii]CAG8378337.1 unnamed protein product [Penicillium salamii]CAG8379993.1 unnamed protein product [Penicillium salamii]